MRVIRDGVGRGRARHAVVWAARALAATLVAGLMASAPAAAHSPPSAFGRVGGWGSLGGGDGEFQHPAGIDNDAQGFLYVADSFNNRIQKFTLNGDFVGKFGGPEPASLQPGQLGGGDGEFRGPTDVAVGPRGDVYVVDFLNHRVQRFATDGSFRSTWGGAGSDAGQFLFPDFVDADRHGNVYVSDIGNNRVQKFTRTGRFLREWGSFGTGDGQFNGPHGLALDRQGNVYVTELNGNRVQKFTANGEFLAKWGSTGTSDGEFLGPHGISVEPDGHVWVSELFSHRLQVFERDGRFVARYGRDGGGGLPGDGPCEFFVPEALHAVPDGRLYVADANNNRIQVLGGGSPEPCGAG